MNRREIKWINCAKAIAIIAVLIDHTSGVLYVNQNVTTASYFSVSLFIIISGMMSYLSNERHKLGWFQTFVKSGKGIMIDYLIANAVYMVWINHSFDMKTYLQHVVSFDMAGPFYYVLLYLQLMLISRLMYGVVKKLPERKAWLWEVGVGIVILFISALTTNYTNIFDIYGGGGKVLGGTYLFLFYLGMIISKYDMFSNITIKKAVVFAVAGATLWFAWFQFVCRDNMAIDKKLPFGAGVNPPSITLFVFALTVLVFVCGIFSLFEFFKVSGWITSFVSWIGKHTLYIFLYHILFLNHVLIKCTFIHNIWYLRILYFTVMIFGSIAIGYAVKWIRKGIKLIVFFES